MLEFRSDQPGCQAINDSMIGSRQFFTQVACGHRLEYLLTTAAS